ncbi:MAG: ABC transporter substrate-binding protein [Actinobacteria bacterium]|nr:ABC transporter substrate-binding protein [Actinomycetota bacterium]
MCKARLTRWWRPGSWPGTAAVAAIALLVTSCAAATSTPVEESSGPPACTGPRTAQVQGVVEPIGTDVEPQLPVTVTDVTGAEVTISDASRILALDTYGTLATTVYALGLGDRLVGRDVSTGIPALADLPLVTHNGHELNGEAILDLAPTVVLTDYSIGPLEVQLQLRDSGIPVVIMSDQRSREQIGPQIEAVGEVLGVPEAAAALARSVAVDVEAAEARVAELIPDDPEDRIRMVFLYVRGNAGVYYWFGEGSGADDLIDALGGVDVAAASGLKGSQPLNAEGLVTAAPDLYLMMSAGLESVGDVGGLLSVPGVGDTPAGLNSCIVDMSDFEILSFGPQFPSTLDALAEAIYGGASGSGTT